MSEEVEQTIEASPSKRRSVWEWVRLLIWCCVGVFIGYFGLIPRRFHWLEQPPDGIQGAIIFGAICLFTGWIAEVFTSNKFVVGPRKAALWIIIGLGCIPIVGMIIIAVILIFMQIFK